VELSFSYRPSSFFTIKFSFIITFFLSNNPRATLVSTHSHPLTLNSILSLLFFLIKDIISPSSFFISFYGIIITKKSIL
jgi:hypothetical protein